MRVPLSWLKELVDVDAPTEELAIRLSTTGTAVDKVERLSTGVSGVVVGRVLEKADVPESDKLVVAQVDIGSDRVQVVAGAKNFQAGDLVPVAAPGATVTTLDVPVGVRKMVDGRYESQGMLCSARELGVSEDHGGILVLDSGATVGTDVVTLLALDDEILEFEVYPNRPDQMSVLGIAREVALLYGKKLRYPSADVVEDGAKVSELTSVTIEDSEGCPRYLARIVEGVLFGPSPALVQTRLTACGFRPLGNLVDATNYALLLTGQPLHAFDLDKLDGERIVVRRARPGERLTTLDEQDRELSDAHLVIADASSAQALAGVMGGHESEVGPSTSRVLLESAYFDPISIARTARMLHVRTEASARFERGADPEMVPTAAAIAADMMRVWAGGSVAAGAVDSGRAPERKKIVLRPERVDAILGIHVEVDEASRLLQGLGCELQGGDRLNVLAPSWRPDLEREVDLIEEIARLHGYEAIPAVHRSGYRGGRSPHQILRNRVRDAMLGASLNEATLSTFAPIEDIHAIGYEGALVEVANPMSSDQRHLRPSLLPGLLRAAQRNVARGRGNVRLFEIGKSFHGWDPGAELPSEIEEAAWIIVGSMTAHWSAPDRFADVYDSKGITRVLLDEIGIDRWDVTPDAGMPLHPGRSARISVGGVVVGLIGEVRPSVAKAFDLDGAVVGSLSLEPLFTHARTELKVSELATQPPVLRDISMWLPEGVTVEEVLGTIEANGGEFLEGMEVLDEYRPEGETRRSVAFGLTFRAPDRTLRAQEADASREAIATACKERHEAEIR